MKRIHRSNLVGLGVLPLQFKSGENATLLGLDGTEIYHITGIASDLRPHKEISVTATAKDGSSKRFEAIARLDSQMDVEYYLNGGILKTVLRQLLK